MIPIEIHIGDVITHQEVPGLAESLKEFLVQIYSLKVKVPERFSLAYEDGEQDKVSITNEEEYRLFREVGWSSVVVHISEEDGGLEWRRTVLEYQIGQQFSEQVNFLECSLNRT